MSLDKTFAFVNLLKSVDIERPIQMGIVDETLPSHGGAGLFEVNPHDNEKIIDVGLRCFDEPARVFPSGIGVMDRTWAHDDEQTPIFPF